MKMTVKTQQIETKLARDYFDPYEHFVCEDGTTLADCGLSEWGDDVPIHHKVKKASFEAYLLLRGMFGKKVDEYEYILFDADPPYKIKISKLHEHTKRNYKKYWNRTEKLDELLSELIGMGE
jgi:hypothetical protein